MIVSRAPTRITFAGGEIKRGKELNKKPFTGKFALATCLDCGKKRWLLLRLRDNKLPSVRCHSCANRINPFIRTQGGRVKDKYGYINIKLHPNDFFYPMVGRNGYVKEHRLVVAKALGRCLQSWEIVHHKRGFAKDDNRYPETLQLVAEGQHNQITIMETKIRQLEQRVILLEAENVLLRGGAK